MNPDPIEQTPSADIIRILLVDDGRGSLSYIHELLSQCDFSGFHLKCVTALVTATNEFRTHSYDICIIDSHRAEDFLAQARVLSCSIPAIVLTSTSGIEVLRAIHGGAADCLFRNQLSVPLLELSINRTVQQARESAAQQENERRYLGLIENAKDIIYTHDLQGNYKSANKSAERLTGYTGEEILRLNATQVVAEEYIALTREMVDLKLDQQTATSYELEMLTKDGHRVPVEVNTHLIYSAGKPVAVQGIARDITERLRSELERRVILEIIQSVNLTSNLDELLRLIHQALGKILYAENCFIALYEKETDHFRRPFFVDRFSKSLPAEMSKGGVAAHVFRTNQPILLNRESLAQLVTRGDVEVVGRFSSSWLGVPLNSPSETIGVLVVQHYEDDNAYTQRDLDFLNSVGGQIALAIERKRAEEALKKSEREYRDIFDNATMGIYRSTKDGSLLTANRALAQILGYSSVAELLQRNLGADIYCDPHERARLIVQQARTGSTEGLEVLWKKKNGDPIWVQLNALSIQSELDETLCCDGFVHDITERKAAERDLRETEDRYQRLVELSPDGIIVHSEGLVNFINGSALRLIGAPNAEGIIGHPIYNLVQAGERERVMDRVVRLGKGELLSPAEVRARRLDGSEFECEVMSVPFMQHDKPAVQLVVRDITERKMSEQALDEANRRALADYERLVERMAALGQSLGNAKNLQSVLRAVRDFTIVSVPCDGLIISLYEAEKSIRRPVYCWVDNEEIETDEFRDWPVGDGLTGQAITSGEITINNDWAPIRSITIGNSSEETTPRAGLSAPMIIMGRTVGCIEVQSYQPNAFTEEHKAAMRMAASLAANAVENVALIDREQEKADQLRQSQKMEAVGQLAGGVAHDFNNLLTAISGYSELGLRQLTDNDPLRRHLEEISKASTRATSLTRQLLAFSRKQMLQAKVIDLNAIVGDMDRMLRRLIGEDIDLVSVLEPSSCQVKADPGQIEQVIMNLAVNARDAMPRGGKLTVETGHVYLDEAYARAHVAVQSGNYVMLAFSDTGIGMDAETQKRVFEPFYTTKEVGKGTGLGLSTVYGIVKQSGGNIWLYSEIGKGSTFKVYLPIVSEGSDVSEGKVNAPELSQSRETILLVEDEEMVRNLTREILEMNGYQVLTAADGAEGSRVCDTYSDEIHLMITDVVMPQMSGRELAEFATRKRPDMLVLYMSGYTDDAVVRHGVLDHDMPFLQKPFSPDSLARKVRELLEEAPVAIR